MFKGKAHSHGFEHIWRIDSVYVPVSSFSPSLCFIELQFMFYWVCFIEFLLLSSSLCPSIKFHLRLSPSLCFIELQMSLRHSSDFLYLCSFTLKLRQNCNVFGWYTCIKTAPSLVYTVHYWLYILYIIVMVRIILEWLWPF